MRSFCSLPFILFLCIFWGLYIERQKQQEPFGRKMFYMIQLYKSASQYERLNLSVLQASVIFMIDIVIHTISSALMSRGYNG